MKRLVVSCVVSLVFCLSSSAYAADIHFGNGQVIATFAAAIAAGSNGDDFYFYGQTETNQTIDFNLNNCTFQAGDGADYILDGQLGTQDGLTISGTGNTFDFGGQFKLTGYGSQVFTVSGAGNVISDAYVYANGYALAGRCYNIVITGASHLIRPVITGCLDHGDRQYGYYINGATVQLTDAVMSNTVMVAGGSRIYGILTDGACGATLVDGITFDGLESPVEFMLFSNGTAAADVAKFRRVIIRNCAGSSTGYYIYAYDKGVDVENFVVHDCSGGNVKGVTLWSPTGFPAGSVNRIVNGVVYNMAGDGIVIDSDFAGSQATIRNVVSFSNDSEGFVDLGSVPPDSDYNLAYNNPIADYSGWVKGPNDLEGIDPLFADPANGNFYLLPESPCIDSGEWQTGRTRDTAGQPTSGPAMDRGAYEFQQTGTRDKRSYLFQDVPRPSRQVRHR